MKRHRLPVIILIALMFNFTSAMRVLAGCNYIDPRYSASGYQAWCRCIGGTPYPSGGTWACTPPRQSGSSSGGVSTGDPFYQLGYKIGEGLGKLIFGDPEEQARRQAELEAAQRQAKIDQELFEKEQARIREERYQRITSLLKGLEGSGSLQLKGIPSGDTLQLKTGTAFFNIPGNPSGNFPATELKLKLTDSSYGTSVNSSPLAQLNSAAFLSKKAVEAKNTEDAAALSDAAFEVVTKGTVQLRIPPEVQGVPVSQAQIEKLSSVQRDFLNAQDKIQKASQQLADVEYKKRIAEQARQEAAKRLKEAQALLQSVPVNNKEDKKAMDDKAAEAQKLLEEATKLDERMTEELDKAKKTSDDAQKAFDGVEKETRKYVTELGGSNASKQ